MMIEAPKGQVLLVIIRPIAMHMSDLPFLNG